MITADMLEHLTTMGTRQLERLAAISGYDGDCYSTAEFLGITNGGQFCYKVTYVEEGETHKSKVFLTYHYGEDRVSLDY